MPRSQKVLSGHPEQGEEPDSEVCELGKILHSWFGHGAVPLTDALGSHGPIQAGKVPLSNPVEELHQGGECEDHQAGQGLPLNLQWVLKVQDLSGSTGRTAYPAEIALFEPGDQQGLYVFVSLEIRVAGPGALAVKRGMTGFEIGDTAASESMAGVVSEAACRAETGPAVVGQIEPVP